MNFDQNICSITPFARARRWANSVGLVALLVSLPAGPAVAGTYDGAMGRTHYVVMTGDVNGDGKNDVLMKAVPTIVLIPVDDDLSVPVPIPVPSPSFALISTSAGGYTLVVNPGTDILGSAAWLPATQQLTFIAASGTSAGSVTISAATNDQASFVVSMAAATGQLELSSTTMPVSGGTASSATPIAVNVATPHLDNADAGTLPGALSVNENGAVAYSIDLVVPPGTAGMQPALSLTYSSKGDNGHAGLGWAVSGNASIQRCAKTIAQDGAYDRITFSNSDRLCFNGDRLVRIDGANPGSDTAARDTAYWAAGAVYRTERENFVRITRLDNLGFKAEEKNGRIHFFGTDISSASQAQGRSDGKPMQWMLARTEDRTGNYITWEYKVNSANGEVTPKQIRYGGNTNAGLMPDLAVRFEYEVRTDTQGAFVGGSRNDMTLRLINIKTYIDTDAAGNGGTLARGYQLHYKESTASGRSLVDWIQASATNPNTNVLEFLPKTSFESADSPAPPALVTDAPFAWPHFDINPFNPIPTGSQKVREPQQALVRMDGTGRTSMVSVHMMGCGMYAEPMCFDPDFGILHATGRVGIRSPEGVYSEITVDFSPLRDPALGALQMGIARKTPSYIEFGDINGDGRDDILAVDFSGSNWSGDRWVWGVCLNDGTDGVAHFTCKPGATTNPIMAELRSDKKMHMVSFDGLGNPGTDCFYSNETLKIECKSMAVTMETPLPDDLKKLNRQNFFKPRGANFGRSMTDFYALWEADVPAAVPSDPYTTMWYYDTAQGTGIWTPIDKIQGISTCFYSEKGLNCKTIEQIRSVGKLMRNISAPNSVGDLNGDGLTDFMYVVRAPKPLPPGIAGTDYDFGIQAPSEIHVCLSKETSVECTTQSKTFLPNADYTDPASTAHIDDFTGDGIMRVLFDVAPNAPSLDGAKSELCRLTPTGFVCQDIPYLPVSTMDYQTNMVTITNKRYEGGAAVLSTSGVSTNFVKSPTRIDGAQAWTPWRMAAPPEQDKLTRVVNGVGYTSEVSYARGDDGSVHSRFATIGNVVERPVYPQVMSSPGVLVKEVRRSNGKGGMRKTGYSYEGYMGNAEGRTGSSFGKITQTDVEKQMSISSVYRRDFPFAGDLVRKTVTSRSGVVMSDMTAHSEKQEFVFGSGAKTFFTYLESSTSTKNDLNGSAINSVSVNNKYEDSWGNLTSASETTFGGGTTFTGLKVVTFKNDATNWLLGLPELVSVTNTHPDAGAITRTMNYEYDANGALSREVVEKGTLLQRDIVHYRNINKFGLVDKTVQKWTDPNSGRLMARNLMDVDFDARGRFVNTARDALGHVATSQYYAATGAPRSARDANMLVTTWTVDGFGRLQVELRPDGSETRNYLKSCDATCPTGATRATIVENFKAGERTATPYVSYSDSAGHGLRALTWAFNGKATYTDTRFDDLGRPEEFDHPRFADGVAVLAQKNIYDDLDRVIEVQTRDTGGGTLSIKTTYNGAEVVHTNQIGKSTTEIRDAFGRVIETRDAKGGVANETYDAFGNLLTAKNPNGNVISVVYDRLGRRTDMVDPDLGLIHYDVDPLGRTWKQTSAKQRASNQFTRIEYDALDRMTGRYESDLVSNWTYDSANMGIGKLAEAYTTTGGLKDYQRLHTYDSFGREGTTTQLIGGSVYRDTPAYDSWGRLSRETHQRGAGSVKAFDFRYNNMGYLASVERGSLTLWRVTATDAASRPTEIHLGNGLVQTSVFEPYTARLDNNDLRLAGALRLTDSYKYDKVGNVNQRDQLWDIGNFSESFGYDELNRLTSSTIGTNVKTFAYDAAGNLKSKTGSGSGDYVYPPQGAGAVRPHAVQSIPGIGNFTYDVNGNLESGAGRTVSWNSFDMPIRIARAQTWSSFVYGPEHQRTLQQSSSGTVTAYAGAIEAVQNGSVLTVKTYWPNELGLEVERADGTVEMNWTHKDVLGSPVAITDSAGGLKERLTYDAWGKRRTTDGSATPDALDGVVDNRGYTGHEMLDQLDLVHMNGRVYDPLVARFLSADPHVSDPNDGQSFNRYSYVLNNPMGYTDPTGFDREIWTNDCYPDGKVHINSPAPIHIDTSASTVRMSSAGGGMREARATGRGASESSGVHATSAGANGGSNGAAGTASEDCGGDPNCRAFFGAQILAPGVPARGPGIVGMAAAGHHEFPQTFWRKSAALSKGVKQIFDRAVVKPGKLHGWSKPHGAYNRIAQKAWNYFKGARGTDLDTIDEGTAKDFLDFLRSNSELSRFNYETATGSKLTMPNELAPLPALPPVVQPEVVPEIIPEIIVPEVLVPEILIIP